MSVAIRSVTFVIFVKEGSPREDATTLSTMTLNTLGRIVTHGINYTQHYDTQPNYNAVPLHII